MEAGAALLNMVIKEGCSWKPKTFLISQSFKKKDVANSVFCGNERERNVMNNPKECISLKKILHLVLATFFLLAVANLAG